VTRNSAGSPSAEVAFTVADEVQHRGVGTLLLEHLISLARGRGFRAFRAETLTENVLMLKVFADAGLRPQRSLVDGVYDFTFPLPADEADTRASVRRAAPPSIWARPCRGGGRPAPCRTRWTTRRPDGWPTPGSADVSTWPERPDLDEYSGRASVSACHGICRFVVREQTSAGLRRQPAGTRAGDRRRRS